MLQIKRVASPTKWGENRRLNFMKYILYLVYIVYLSILDQQVHTVEV